MLDRYFHNTGRFAVSDGSIRHRDLWLLCVGDDHTDRVIMFLGDHHRSPRWLMDENEVDYELTRRDEPAMPSTTESLPNGSRRLVKEAEPIRSDQLLIPPCTNALFRHRIGADMIEWQRDP